MCQNEEKIINGAPFALRRIRQLYAGVYDILCRHRIQVLLFSFLIVLIPFFIARLPFFLYYPMPLIHPDTGGYWDIVWRMENGELPVFSYRTPGLPIFMYLVFKLIAPRLMAVIVVQNIIALMSLFLMVYCVYRVRNLFVLTPLAALAMGVFTFGGLQLNLDLSLLTESLYSSCMIIAFALLLTGLYERRLWAFGVSSAFMALSIMVRPTGEFLVVTYLMVMAFLLFNRCRYKWKRILAFVVPFIMILFSWMTYNYFTFGKFKLTDGFEITLVCATSMYFVESPEFSKQLNAAICKVLSRISPEDKKLIYGPSWDFMKIGAAYYRGRYWDLGAILIPLNDENIPEFRELGQVNFYRKLALHTLAENRKMFFKVYAMNIYLYLFKNTPKLFRPYFEDFPDFYDKIYIRKYFQNVLPEAQARSLLKEYYSASPLSCFNVIKTSSSPSAYTVEITAPFLTRFYDIISRCMKIFRLNIWVVASLFICLFSGIMTLLTKFRNINAFFLLVLTSAPIGHCLVCSIFVHEVRFSAPTFFIYYLSVALMPILIFKNRIRKEHD